MIHVIATVQVAQGHRNDFLAAFRELMPQVHAEDGCVEYGPAIDADTDIPAQSRKGDDVLTIIEKWESIDALKAHLVAPHMLEYRSRVKNLVAGSTLHVLESA